MHEWALAESVISTALKKAEEGGFKKVTRIKVNLGELQQIDRTILETALEKMTKAKELADVKIELEDEKAVLECNACGKRWPFEDALKKLDEGQSESLHFIPETAHAHIRCPECGSPDFSVRGRGVSVESVEGE